MITIADYGQGSLRVTVGYELIVKHNRSEAHIDNISHGSGSGWDTIA